MTRRPGWAGADNALPAYGLRAKVRRVGWATLTEHKWVSFGERRGPAWGVPSRVSQKYWGVAGLDSAKTGRGSRSSGLVVAHTLVVAIRR